MEAHSELGPGLVVVHLVGGLWSLEWASLAQGRFQVAAAVLEGLAPSGRVQVAAAAR